MTGLDGTQTEQKEAPDMQGLGKAMSTAFSKFTECRQIEINNSEFISERNKEIAEEGEKFQEYANQSIKQSDKLSKYAEDVIVFAVTCADPSFTKEELLDFLKLTLEDAKNNKFEAETLKTQISGILANLINIQNECVQYGIDIQKNARKIDSTTVNQLEGAESKQKLFDKTFKVGTGFAILGGVASLIAVPFTGGASLAIPIAAEAIAIFEAGLILAGSTGAIALGSKYASDKGNNEIEVLNRQLNTERDQLNFKIELLSKNLGSIVGESSGIVNFWDEQITTLDELIKKLDQDGELPSRLVSLTIQKKWNNVSRECKEYNRDIRAVLQMSNMSISN